MFLPILEKKVEKETVVRPVFEKPTFINSPKIEKLQLPIAEQFGLDSTKQDHRAAIKHKGGESAGIERLQNYFFNTKNISKYKETRNEMVGENYSTKFSAYLAFGCLSSREIYNQLKQYEAQFSANESTYWLVFELMWRDYFRFMMKKHRHKFFFTKWN